MKNLDDIRHSLAHLLAASVMEIYPDAKRAIGPAIDNGFYFDFEFSRPISDADLPRIEKKMREILPTWEAFEKIELDKEDAINEYPDNPYKKELIEEFSKESDLLSFYQSGSYRDLCRGGHANNMKDIDKNSFKLSHTAGAYWRGDENNTMLTRIYGLAFESAKHLAEYEKQQEETTKRDHRKIGRELDLFSFSDKVGAGLALWSPKGTILRNILNDFVWKLRKDRGYEQVEIPHITKKDLFETSGHWDKFGDELFKIHTREDHEFALKPMNCPFHTQIYDRRPHSYKDMPQLYANTTMVYRDEQTGELSGLSRVRCITQDDAHAFCRTSQVEEEAGKIWDIVHDFYGTFGFPLDVTLSLHDSENMDNYLGTAEVWKNAEQQLREVIKSKSGKAEEIVGEAAFYGPKIDFIATDSLGRKWQVATIQLDMNMPERFDLVCTNEKGKKERIVMLHAAIMGSIERFLAVYIEHTAGLFPFWLSPVQIIVLPIADAHKKYAQEVFDKLKENDIRVEIDDSNEGLGKKIRNWKLERVPYAIIVGDEEVKSQKLKVESRDTDKSQSLNLKTLLEKLLDKTIKKA